VPKIGEKIADKMVATRKAAGRPLNWNWLDFQKTPGVGAKTVEKLMDFANADDPFGAYRIERDINEAIRQIQDGAVGLKGESLPWPSHEAGELQDMPIMRQRQPVVWLGTIVKRNIRDMFEVNLAKRGEALDASSIKNPELSEFAILTGIDRQDMLLIKIDRWKWPAFKEAIFNMDMNKDLLLIKGKRPQYRSAYGLIVEDLWVLDTSED
jgi:hypothetical protein